MIADNQHAYVEHDGVLYHIAFWRDQVQSIGVHIPQDGSESQQRLIDAARAKVLSRIADGADERLALRQWKGHQ